jgi:hypothetical protein
MSLQFGVAGGDQRNGCWKNKGRTTVPPLEKDSLLLVASLMQNYGIRTSQDDGSVPRENKPHAYGMGTLPYYYS